MLALKFNGIHPMHRWRDEMEQFVDQFLPDTGWFDTQASGRGAFPAVNVWEDGDVFLAEVEVPGMSMDQLDVQVIGRTLTIRGERTAPTDGKTLHRQERSFGKFERVLQLPTALNAEQVEARLNAGVLSIRLPKAASARARKIEVQFGK